MRTGELVFRIVTGGKGEAVRGLRLRPDQGIAGAVFTSGEPLIVNQAHTDPRFYRLDDQTGFTTRNLLAVPLIGQAGPIGVIEVMNRRDEQPYNLRDQDRLLLLASQAAIAIDNARLYQAQRLRVEQLSLLNQVGRRIAAILDLDELLDQVVRLVRDTFNYYSVSIGLLEGDELVFEHGVIDPAKIIPGATPPFPIRFPVQGLGLLAWAAREGECAYAPDVHADTRYLFVHYLPAARSELAVPLKVGDRVVGVLDVESDEPNAFDSHDQTLLESLADQIAIAVENARLVQEQQEEAWVTTALFQASEALASLTRLEDVLDTTVRLIPILVGVERCLIFLWDPAAERYEAAAAFGLPNPAQQTFRGLRLQPGLESIASAAKDKAANHREVFLIPCLLCWRSGAGFGALRFFLRLRLLTGRLFAREQPLLNDFGETVQGDGVHVGLEIPVEVHILAVGQGNAQLPDGG